MTVYEDTKIDEKLFFRAIPEDCDDSELIWHLDSRDRIITVESGENWAFQLDDMLPIYIKVGYSYFIPKETYHRVIKGSGDLRIKIKELE